MSKPTPATCANPRQSAKNEGHHRGHHGNTRVTQALAAKRFEKIERLALNQRVEGSSPSGGTLTGAADSCQTTPIGVKAIDRKGLGPQSSDWSQMLFMPWIANLRQSRPIKEKPRAPWRAPLGHEMGPERTTVAVVSLQQTPARRV